MMANGRVNPGQKLTTAFSARAWNRAQDAADIVLGDRGGVAEAEGGKTARAVNVIRVFNSTAYDVPIHGVLDLNGFPFINEAPFSFSPAGGTMTGTGTADARARQLVESIVMRGDTPAANSSRFCITLEPIPAAKYGRAAIAGVMLLKVKLPTSSQFFYATTRANDRTQLIAASCGPVRLLWHETGPGDDKWAVAVLS